LKRGRERDDGGEGGREKKIERRKGDNNTMEEGRDRERETERKKATERRKDEVCGH
jgi:hypothetical protein